ncbi:hypothetical protein B0H16DRAFT_1731538 [Mycena metata]|uniref:Uncharacterized protein n=1 Tax=Mycena metata TaxID=1033252 RepID=A0AAD7I615_9AGAR|nr:hypothetical protein B0H16DRAFT_1731538 [Mycena metata]
MSFHSQLSPVFLSWNLPGVDAAFRFRGRQRECELGRGEIAPGAPRLYQLRHPRRYTRRRPRPPMVPWRPRTVLDTLDCLNTNARTDLDFAFAAAQSTPRDDRERERR